MAACHFNWSTPNSATPNRIAAIKGYGPLPAQGVWATQKVAHTLLCAGCVRWYGPLAFQGVWATGFPRGMGLWLPKGYGPVSAASAH